jgi:hypothetical protein
MTLTRAQTLPPGYVAQPVGGGEHNGITWELDRIYDPTGAEFTRLTTRTAVSTSSSMGRITSCCTRAKSSRS